MSDATIQLDYTPAQAAKVMGKGREFVVSLINAGELEARDERKPGSTLPRYRIPHSAIDAWRRSRTVPKFVERVETQRLPVRLVGVLDQRIASIQAKAKREADRRQSA